MEERETDRKTIIGGILMRGQARKEKVSRGT